METYTFTNPTKMNSYLEHKVQEINAHHTEFKDLSIDTVYTREVK